MPINVHLASDMIAGDCLSDPSDLSRLRRVAKQKGIDIIQIKTMSEADVLLVRGAIC